MLFHFKFVPECSRCSKNKTKKNIKDNSDSSDEPGKYNLILVEPKRLSLNSTFITALLDIWIVFIRVKIFGRQRGNKKANKKPAINQYLKFANVSRRQNSLKIAIMKQKNRQNSPCTNTVYKKLIICFVQKEIYLYTV